MDKPELLRRVEFLLVLVLTGVPGWTAAASAEPLDSAAFLVVDEQDRAVYGYDPAGSLVGSFSLDPSNSHPSSIAGDLATVYVLDRGTKRIYRYQSGVLSAVSNELRLGDGRSLSRPSGLAIRGGETWVLDGGRLAILRYSLAAAFSTARRVRADGEVALDPANSRAEDLAIDDVLLYVLDEIDKRLCVYRRSGGELVVVSPILQQTDGNNLGAPSGVTVEGDSIAIVDRSRKRVLRYPVDEVFGGTAGDQVPARDDFRLSLDNADARGLRAPPEFVVRPRAIQLTCQGPANFSSSASLRWTVGGVAKPGPTFDLTCTDSEESPALPLRPPNGVTGYEVSMTIKEVIGGRVTGRSCTESHPLPVQHTVCQTPLLPGSRAVFSYD